ncbi:MAG: hypothetical protein AAGD13_01010 [Pseudomonadota bacterium]
MENPALAGAGSEYCSSGLLNTSEHNKSGQKVQRKLQVARLRHRFGMSEVRANVIAYLAFGGGANG